MKCEELLFKVRYRLNDMGKRFYSDEELMNDANQVIIDTGNDLIAQKHQYSIARATFTDGDTLPIGWRGWCGVPPMETYGDVVKLFTGYSSVTAKYFKMPQALSGLDDDVELPSEVLPKVISSISIAALNRNNMGITQDATILAAVEATRKTSQSVADPKEGAQP